MCNKDISCIWGDCSSPCLFSVDQCQHKGEALLDVTQKWLEAKSLKGGKASCGHCFSGWWLGHPSEKYESQLGWLFPIDGKIKLMFQTTNQVFNHLSLLLYVASCLGSVDVRLQSQVFFSVHPPESARDKSALKQIKNMELEHSNNYLKQTAKLRCPPKDRFISISGNRNESVELATTWFVLLITSVFHG